jgi:hypothetical protein
MPGFTLNGTLCIYFNPYLLHGYQDSTIQLINLKNKLFMGSTNSQKLCKAGPSVRVIAFPFFFSQKRKCIVFLLSQVTKRVWSTTSPPLHDVERASDNPNG